MNVNMVKGKICGQYVNSVIAKEAMNAGYDEAIMLDVNGYVSECTETFMVRNNKIVTAPFGRYSGWNYSRHLITLARDLGVVVESA